MNRNFVLFPAPCKHRILVPLILLGGSFQEPWVGNSLTHVHGSQFLLNTPEGPLADSQDFLSNSSLVFSTLSCELQPSWFCHKSKLHLLNPVCLPDPDSVSPSCIMTWKSFWAVSWHDPRAHLICFLSLRDHCPSLSDFCFLENHFHVFHPVFYCFQEESKCSTCYVTLVGRSSPGAI